MGRDAEVSYVLNSIFSVTGDRSNTPSRQVPLTLISFCSRYFTTYPIDSSYLTLFSLKSQALWEAPLPDSS